MGSEIPRFWAYNPGRARAVLAIGFAGALRRSELVALRVEDIRRDAEGIRVVIRRSKPGQEGGGALIMRPGRLAEARPGHNP